MMAGALTGDQPARVVRFENRNGVANPNLRGRGSQAGEGMQRKKKTEREQRTEKWLKNAYWVIFCCGLCEDWDLAVDSQRRGAQTVALREEERR